MASASLSRPYHPHPYQVQQAQGWYSNNDARWASLQRVEQEDAQTQETDHHSNDTVLADVFREAKKAFEDTLCENEDDRSWISGRASIKDVLEVVNDAQNVYHGKRASKAWKWLTQFSSRVTYYSSILDVMVQHHPEYAALAWGAMKLLFVVSMFLRLLQLPL